MLESLRHISVKWLIPRFFLEQDSLQRWNSSEHLFSLNIIILISSSMFSYWHRSKSLSLLSWKPYFVYLCLCSRQLCHCHGSSFAGLTWGLNKIGQNWRKLAQIGPNESWSESWQLIVSWVRVIPGLPGWGWLPGPEANIPDIISQGFTLVQIITNSYNSAMADPLSSTAASGIN